MKVFFLGVALAIFPGILFADSNAEDVAALLFQEFGTKCGSQGAFTQRALSETRSLQRILEQIKNDRACESLLPVMESIIPLTEQLPLLAQGILRDEERDEMDRYMDRLSRALALSTSPQQQATLSSEIASVQFKLYSRTYDQDAARRIARARTLQAISDYAQQLSKLPSASLCFEKHKTLPFQLAGHLVSLAGAFLGPVFNTALVIGGQLFQSFFNYLGNASIIREIKKYRATGMWLGLSCTMEALEDTYCDIRDQRNIIDLQRSILWTDQIPEIWKGYDLMVRDYDVIKDFFQALKSGAGASSEDQGYRIQDLKTREGKFLGVKDYFEGLIRDAEKKFRLANASSSQQTIIKNLIDTLSSMGQYTYSSAVAEGDRNRVELWLRIGNPYPPIPENKTLQDVLNSLDTPNSAYSAQDAVAKRSIPMVRARIKEVENAADQQLAIDKQLILSADPRRTMSFFSRVDGIKDSPENIWIKMLSFLEKLQLSWSEHPEYFISPSAQELQLAYIGETKKVLLDAFNILTDKNLNDSEKLVQVFDILRLQDDDLFITNRMSDHVDTDLDIKMRLGLLRDRESLETVVRISSGKIINTLSPTGSLTDLEKDLENAEFLAYQNLKNFSETFGESIENSLDLLMEGDVDQGSVPGSIFARNYSKLCALALNFPKISKSLLKKCASRVYGINEKGVIEYDWNLKPLIVDFDQQVSKTYTERTCAYTRYENELKLIEFFKHRPSPFLTQISVSRADGSQSIHQIYK